MAIPLMAIPAAIGAAQAIGGLVSAAGNREPSLDPLRKNLSEAESVARAAQNRASFGFSPEVLAQMNQQFQGAQAQALANARNLGVGGAQAQNAATIAAMQAGQGMQGVMAQNELERARKQQEADAARMNVAQFRNDLFGEQSRRFQERAAASSALIGSGLDNIMGGVMGQATLNQGAEYTKGLEQAYKDFNAPENQLGVYLPEAMEASLSKYLNNPSSPTSKSTLGMPEASLIPTARRGASSTQLAEMARLSALRNLASRGMNLFRQ